MHAAISPPPRDRRWQWRRIRATRSQAVDVIYGGAGNDAITVAGRADNYEPGSIDYVYGESGNDLIKVEGHSVVAHGGDGADTIMTELGAGNLLIGESGSDRFMVTKFAYHEYQPEFYGGEFDSANGLGADTSVDTLDLSALDTATVGTPWVNLADGVLGATDVLLDPARPRSARGRRQRRHRGWWRCGLGRRSRRCFEGQPQRVAVHRLSSAGACPHPVRRPRRRMGLFSPASLEKEGEVRVNPRGTPCGSSA